jgi:hypothetical protein
MIMENGRTGRENMKRSALGQQAILRFELQTLGVGDKGKAEDNTQYELSYLHKHVVIVCR